MAGRKAGENCPVREFKAACGHAPWPTPTNEQPVSPAALAAREEAKKTAGPKAATVLVGRVRLGWEAKPRAWAYQRALMW
jgi:hypothetical protein